MSDADNLDFSSATDALPPELLESAAVLHSALLAHDLPAVKAALADGAPAWYQSPDSGWGALHYAAEWGSEEAVRAVLEGGGVWNAVDNLGNTAGDIAISRNEEGTYTLIRDAGLRSELLLNLLASHSALKVLDPTPAGDLESFLASRLVYRQDGAGQEVCAVVVQDADGRDVQVGVMMGWERRIMEETVHLLSEAEPPEGVDGLRVLNVGFGLGIIDSLFQALSPTRHTIIEPHPDVLAHMQATGWMGKKGVEVRRGKWQDVLSAQGEQGERWDVVFFDTFSEDYADLMEFFALLPHILSGPHARFSFFNGLGATNALFYDVSTRLAELHLAQLRIETEWEDVWVEQDVRDAWEDTRSYFRVGWYRLPVGRLRAG
ncbi:hypothetical protein CALCODRAFT_440917 [Calocera cornea HHB12733]|uniref:RMT2 domain-containing protein n=1 Tax=Calocera cornea HHB12733 TaxID=1353952 RepID=A0A165DIM2_9BASI|nr:hypothetical protein CALCODRAFT_440917 [Calocera cornea HHB12733]